MKENVVKSKSFEFAKRIVKLYNYLCDNKKEFVMSKQLLRCGTSVGANIYEAERGVSKKDFANKMSIAQKESNESMYWIELLYATGYLQEKEYMSLKKECDEISRLLAAIVKTSFQN